MTQRMCRALLVRLLLAGALPAVVGGSAAYAQEVAARTGSTALQLLFEREPIQQGLAFVREKIAPKTVTFGGKTETVWTAQAGSAPDGAFRRAININLTDPRFLDGKMPVVDIEVVYQKDSRATTALFCDTADGFQQVASRFGANEKGYLTLSARLNRARFRSGAGGTPHLRLTSANDLNIRSIRVMGYDRDTNVDYARLLQLEKIEGPRSVLVFHPGRQEPLRYRLRNYARRPVETGYTATLTDAQGAVKALHTGTVSVPGEQAAAVTVPVDTKGFRYGVYLLNFALTEKKPGGDAPILARESYLGVISETKLPKAKDGEFLYGLDVTLGSSYDKPELLTWTDYMGVDIIRHGFNSNEVAEVAQHLPVYQRHGLRVLYNLEIPWNEDPKRRQELFAQKAKRGQEIARQFPQLRYWELGNEPDLPFFYGGPIEEYTTGMAQAARGIKAGNPNTVIMNGGLSFAHTVGTERSRRFVEVVDLGTVDALAYHGHGPGAQAERAALERMRRTVREFGKHTKPLIETESGVAARTRVQEEMQARTAVQKLVYAQAERLPLFIWFRLLMFSEDYGNLRTEQEPRPAVLTYRATVEALRGLRYVRRVDTGKPEVEAYLFAAPAGGKRVCVLWTGKPEGLQSVALSLASRPSGARNVRLRDMYGNADPAALTGAADALLMVGEDPILLTWETAEPTFAVRKARVLETAPELPLVHGVDSSVATTLRNPYPRALSVTVEAAAESGAPGAVVGPTRQRVSLPPGGKRMVQWKVRPAAESEGLVWPEQWTVFLNTAETVDLSRLPAGVPVSVPGKNGAEATRRTVRPSAATIDFVRAGGQQQEKEIAVAFAEVESDADRVVKIGASADYWMAWYVNGKPVYDTLAVGNGGGYAITDHTFTIPLRKGKNLLAAKVLSGKMGWKLLIGDPPRVAKALAPGRRRAEYLSLTAYENRAPGSTAVLARELVQMQKASAVAAPPAGISLATLGELREQAEPDVSLTGDTVQNLFAAEPDTSRWWKGTNDLSAQSWVRADATHLYVLVAVRDDVVTPATARERLEEADGVQIAVSPNGSETTLYTIGMRNGKPVAVERRSGESGPKPAVGVQAAITRLEDGTTLYSLVLPRSAAEREALFLNLRVNDNDGYGRKQFLVWRPGWAEKLEPQQWYRAVLAETK